MAASTTEKMTIKPEPKEKSNGKKKPGVPRVKVSVLMLDGRTFEGVGPYQPLADRVAYERRFGSSVIDMAKRTARVVTGDDPDVEMGAAEEKVAFFPWCVLRRAEACPLDFEEFIEGVDDIKIELERPTTRRAQPQTS